MAHRLAYHSTLGWRVIKKKKVRGGQAPRGRHEGSPHLPPCLECRRWLLDVQGAVLALVVRQ